MKHIKCVSDMLHSVNTISYLFLPLKCEHINIKLLQRLTYMLNNVWVIYYNIHMLQ